MGSKTREQSYSPFAKTRIPLSSLYFKSFSRLKAIRFQTASQFEAISEPLKKYAMSRHRVTWDEAKIREYEKGKPVRQKITEPKTPCHPTIDADISSVSPLQTASELIHQSALSESLILALNDVASSKQTQFGGWTSEEEEVDHDSDQAGDPAKDKSGKRFQERRRGGYELRSTVDGELSEEARTIEIEGGCEILRTIEIEGSDETALDVEILEGRPT